MSSVVATGRRMNKREGLMNPMLLSVTLLNLIFPKMLPNGTSLKLFPPKPFQKPSFQRR
jgi:hypothetical protein